MKRIIIILLFLLETANFLAAPAASSDSGFAGIHGPTEGVFLKPAADTKKVEDKMADALAKLESWKKSQGKGRIKPADESADLAELNRFNMVQSNSTQVNSTQSNSAQSNLTSANSTLKNSSIISSPGNSSLDSFSEDHSADAYKADANDASVTDDHKIGSGSAGRFKGYYGMTAARHEIGKSGINSHMFLSGEFEMDKSVKFQDQGID